MSTNSPRKYNFDTVFAADGEIIESADGWRQSISRVEADQKIAEAFDRGRDEETVSVGRQVSSSVEDLSAQVRQLITEMEQVNTKCRTEAVHLAETIAGKIAGAALQQFESEQVSDLIHRTLAELTGAPKLVITTSERVTQTIQDQVPTLLEQTEFAGKLRFVTCEEGVPGRVVLEWSDGAVKFDPAEIEARIGQELESWLHSTTSGEEEPADQKANIEGDADV